MKIQNAKRRRAVATLMALPIVASTLGSSEAFAADKKADFSSKPSYQSSPKVDFTPKSYQPAKPPTVTYQPKQQAPAPKVDFTPKSYQQAKPPTVTYQPKTQAPAPKVDFSQKGYQPTAPPTVTYQPKQRAPEPKVDFSPKGYQPSAPPTVTYQPKQRAPEPKVDFSQKGYQPSAPPTVTYQPKQRAPAPKVDFSPKGYQPSAPPTVTYQPKQRAPEPKVDFSQKGYQPSAPPTVTYKRPDADSGGRGSAFDEKTLKGQTKNKSGTVTKDFSQTFDGYKQNTITFKGAGDTLIKKEYVTRKISVPTTTGSRRRDIEHYIPRDREIIYRDTSSMDYMLMWMLINQANQQQYQSGGSYSTGSSGYSGGGMSMPAPPKVATGFEINWTKIFPIVPESYMGSGTMTYTSPADAVAAFVSLDIINDNSEVPSFWGKVAHYASFGIYDHKKNLKKFEMDSSARTPLTQQVTFMAAAMLNNSEVDLKSVINEQTGELVKDEAGNAPTYYFVVDPSNAMPVKDAETQQTCNLAVASILRPIEALVTGDLRFMKMKVLGGGRSDGSCKAKQVIMIDQSDLEEMNNDLAAKVDEAIHAIPRMSKPIYN